MQGRYRKRVGLNHLTSLNASPFATASSRRIYPSGTERREKGNDRAFGLLISSFPGDPGQKNRSLTKITPGEEGASLLAFFSPSSTSFLPILSCFRVKIGDGEKEEEGVSEKDNFFFQLPG